MTVFRNLFGNAVMHLILHTAIFFWSGTLPVFAKISCMDESNQPVDWYALYKFPEKEEKFPRSMTRRGESYAFLNIDDNGRFKWVLSEKRVQDSDSMLGNTLKSFYDSKESLTYLLYNDEPAVECQQTRYDEQTEETTGHTKGVVVFDENTGFWLVHSIPKFPPDNAYDYPESGLMFGQSALCITFQTKDLNEIGKQLLFNHPDIYSKGLQAATVKSLDDDVKSLFDKEPQFVEDSPFSRTATLRSLKNQTFLSFAKNKQFDDDLYDGLVAPYLRASLFVQSWRRGAGTPLKPSCDKEFQVEDIKFANITVSEKCSYRSIAFSSYDDHSKWAVSSDSKSHWTCIGDINRMKSQYKRGGGTVCIISPGAQAAYTSLIAETDQC